jgi:hypothetical protein
MQNEGRLELAKLAAKKVLDTLTWRDYATIVTFSGGAESYRGTGLFQMTDDEKKDMVDFIEGFVASGSTNFVAAMGDAEMALTTGGGVRGATTSSSS